MCQVATGDSWAGVLARSLFYVCKDKDTGAFLGSPNPPPKLGFERGDCGAGAESVFDSSVLLFFASYSIISCMVLLNVVIAVLLDNFTRCVKDEQKALLIEERNKTGTSLQHDHFVLDPICKHLAEFESLEHLQSLISALWQRLNADDAQSISFTVLSESILALPVPGTQAMILTHDDFDYMTCHGQLCLENGELDYELFTLVMKRQLEHYVRRLVSKTVDECGGGHDAALLGALKLQLSRSPQSHSSDHRHTAAEGSPSKWKWTVSRAAVDSSPPSDEPGRGTLAAARPEGEARGGSGMAGQGQARGAYTMPVARTKEELDKVEYFAFWVYQCLLGLVCVCGASACLRDTDSWTQLCRSFDVQLYSVSCWRILTHVSLAGSNLDPATHSRSLTVGALAVCARVCAQLRPVSERRVRIGIVVALVHALECLSVNTIASIVYKSVHRYGMRCTGDDTSVKHRVDEALDSMCVRGAPFSSSPLPERETSDP